jgi:4-hydroxybenzoate polyprenyltransferase
LVRQGGPTVEPVGVGRPSPQRIREAAPLSRARAHAVAHERPASEADGLDPAEEDSLHPVEQISHEATASSTVQVHPVVDHLFNAFLRVFVYSSVWVAGGLASLALYTDHVLGLNAGWMPVWLIFVSGLFVYNLDHIADARVQEIPDEVAQRYFTHPMVGILLIASGILTGHALWDAPEPARVVFAIYVSIGLLYGLPVIPIPTRGGVRWARLKEIPLLKGFLVGGTIAFAAVFVPLAWVGASFDAAAQSVFLFVFVFASSACQMFDVRDLDSDAKSGLRTLPLTLGVPHTKRGLMALNLMVLCLAMWGWADGVTSPHPEVILSLAATVAYILLVSVKTPRLVYGVAIDGCMYLPAILVTAHVGI